MDTFNVSSQIPEDVDYRQMGLAATHRMPVPSEGMRHHRPRTRSMQEEEERFRAPLSKQDEDERSWDQDYRRRDTFNHPPWGDNRPANSSHHSRQDDDRPRNQHPSWEARDSSFGASSAGFRTAASNTTRRSDRHSADAWRDTEDSADANFCSPSKTRVPRSAATNQPRDETVSASRYLNETSTNYFKDRPHHQSKSTSHHDIAELGETNRTVDKLSPPVSLERRENQHRAPLSNHQKVSLSPIAHSASRQTDKDERGGDVSKNGAKQSVTADWQEKVEVGVVTSVNDKSGKYNLTL